MFDSVKDVFKLDITQRINSTDFINNKLKFNVNTTSNFFTHENGYYKSKKDGSFFLNMFIFFPYVIYKLNVKFLKVFPIL